MVASRRKVKTVISKTGVTLETCWCRKCMKSKKPIDFFDTTDIFLDANGKMSLCKDCCNEIYSNYYKSEHTMEKALLRTCRILNVKYDEAAISATHNHLSTLFENGKETDNIFGIYKSKLIATQNKAIGNRNTTEDFTFVEPSTPIAQNLTDLGEGEVDLSKFWGENFDYNDLIFLENELFEWKRTHKADTKAEIMLLKELCYKGLEIRKTRIEQHSTANLVKELQDLMKTASVDPAKTSQAGSGKAQDTFSSFIQIIEQNEPADFYKDKNLFKDYDNLDFYFKKYVTRPLKNFITQSRDFNVETDDEDDEITEGDMFENLPLEAV